MIVIPISTTTAAAIITITIYYYYNVFSPQKHVGRVFRMCLYLYHFHLHF